MSHLGAKPAMSSSQSINQQEAMGFLPPEMQTIPDNMSPDKLHELELKPVDLETNKFGPPGTTSFLKEKKNLCQRGKQSLSAGSQPIVSAGRDELSRLRDEKRHKSREASHRCIVC